MKSCAHWAIVFFFLFASSSAALAGFKTSKILPLVEKLQSKNVEERVSAARSLGAIQGRASQRALLSASGDTDDRVRREVALSLGFQKEKKARTKLIEYLSIDPNPLIRAAAAEGLGVQKSKKSVPALVDALWDPNSEVRLAASKALGNIGDPAATLPLAERLQDVSSAVRRSAAASMARISDHRAIAPLIYCLRDEDKQVRSVALEALKAITDVNHGDRFEDWWEWFRAEYKYEALRYEEER